jgi:putative membrane protein
MATEQTSQIGHGGSDMLDPDVRFLLANERTLLAWVRTALAVIAGGLALTQLGTASSAKTGFGAGAVLFGAGMAALGYIRFRAADRAIRVGALPEVGWGPLMQVAGVVVIAAAIVTVEVIQMA